MTSLNNSLAGPNAIFLNVILAIIAFILIIYLRNMYVTIIAVVVVVGVYFVFDTKASFQINDDPATPYIESQPMNSSLDNSLDNSRDNSDSVIDEQVIQTTREVELNVGCSGINLNSPDVVKISSYEDFATNTANATDPSKTFVLMNDIDCGNASIDGGVYSNFNASFEGNCFSITNFTITNTSGGDRVGFFEKVNARESPVYIRNVTFTDFSLDIDKHSKYIGIFAQTLSTTSSKSENDVIFENVTVHLNRPSLVTIESQNNHFYFGVFAGHCQYSKLLDCNVILSSRFDMYLSSQNLKKLSYGVLCGFARNSSLMACSSNLIGSDIILNTSDDKLSFGLLCGSSWYDQSAYLNLLNNMIILKDASLKTNYTMVDYGYLLGVRNGTPVVTAKNNTVMSFVDGLYFGVEDKLTSSNLDVDKNNKVNNLASASPSDVSIKDQIYGMQITNNENNQDPGDNTKNASTYWKKVYYVYYEGNTSNMSCRYYDVFNFWKNTELGTYCVEDDMCNTNMYGTCDSGLNRRGWEQLGENVSIKCSNEGKITYRLKTDVRLSSYEAIVLDDGVTFNGNNKTIYYDENSNWPGLFTFIKRDYQIKVKIKNVTIDLGGKKLASGKGSILDTSAFNWENGGDFANYDITIENCHVQNGSMNNYCGGIVGQGFCSNSDSEGSIVNCSNDCDISGKYSGGICAPKCGKYGKLEVRSCWNVGSMSSGTQNGGIMGYNTGSSSSNGYVFIYNCYNTGDFATTSGGICATSNSNGERIMILNCYSTCQIEDLTSFDNGTNTYGGIVSADNNRFKPYVVYCDVYLTYDSAKYLHNKEPNIITRNGYRTVSNIGSNDLNTIGVLLGENLHTTLFNLVSLKSLINELPYDYISPLWSSDNLSIPGFESS